MNIFDDKIKGLIFDLDGTLVDSMKIWKKLLPDFLANYGLTASEEMKKKVTFMTLTQSSAYVAEEFPQLLMTGENIRDIWMDIIYEEYKSEIKLKPGAREIMETAKKKGIKLALATACAKNLTEICLKNNGVYDMFDEIVFAEEIGCGKDSPAVFEETLKRLDCKAEEVLLFEDILMAVKTAGSIGIKTIVIEDESAAADRDEIKRTAYGYIKDFKELLN